MGASRLVRLARRGKLSARGGYRPPANTGHHASSNLLSHRRRERTMKQQLGLSVAVVAVATPQNSPKLHALPAVKWIWDPSFHYTPSYATDLRKTFERIRGQKSRPIIGPIAAAPSPSAASTSRPTIQKAGYSQPPSLFENSHPFLP